jgi:hypothetical protein
MRVVMEEMDQLKSQMSAMERRVERISPERDAARRVASELARAAGLGATGLGATDIAAATDGLTLNSLSIPVPANRTAIPTGPLSARFNNSFSGGSATERADDLDAGIGDVFAEK